MKENSSRETGNTPGNYRRPMLFYTRTLPKGKMEEDSRLVLTLWMV